MVNPQKAMVMTWGWVIFLGSYHTKSLPNIHLDHLDHLGSLLKSADPLIMLRCCECRIFSPPSIVEIHIFEAQCQDRDSAGSHLLPG